MHTEMKTIAAGDVQPGDYIYNSHGYCESAKWVYVICVTTEYGEPYPGTLNKREYTVIHTHVFATWKEPREGVKVKRPLPCPKCGTNGEHYCPADVARS